MVRTRAIALIRGDDSDMLINRNCKIYMDNSNYKLVGIYHLGIKKKIESFLAKKV